MAWLIGNHAGPRAAAQELPDRHAARPGTLDDAQVQRARTAANHEAGRANDELAGRMAIGHDTSFPDLELEALDRGLGTRSRIEGAYLTFELDRGSRPVQHRFRLGDLGGVGHPGGI